MANSFKKSANRTQQKKADVEKTVTEHQDQTAEEPVKEDPAKEIASKETHPKTDGTINSAEEYTTLNFRITKKRKKKLQMYAAEHETKLVTILNNWIDAL